MLDIKEKTILKQLFWPHEKENCLGELVFKKVGDNFSDIKEIKILREKENLVIEYYEYDRIPVTNSDNKNYFIKLFFKREETKNINSPLSVVLPSTHPKFSQNSELETLLFELQKSIVLMSVKPRLTTFGIIESGVIDLPNNELNIPTSNNKR